MIDEEMDIAKGGDFDEFDLAQWDEEFEAAPIEENEFEPIPDGKYQVNVESVELTKAKRSGNPMLKWTLRIIAPHHVGRLLWRNNVLFTPENIKWLKNDLHKCGLDLKSLRDLPRRLDEILDIKLEIQKKTKGENENVYINKKLVLADDESDDIEDNIRRDADKVF